MNLDRALALFQPRLPLAVAFSGGADSTALLLACARKWPGEVRAIHVHHGLQRAADGFEQSCTQLCANLDVPLVVQRVDARHAAGESPENAARMARYRALDDAAANGFAQGPVPSVALAQHADDQVETLLLALSRGAGLPGLAAMPARWQRGGIDYHRPLLEVPGAQLKVWLSERGVAWSEDPTNSDPQYTRNRIRSVLLPALEKAFPSFRETFARSARHAAAAQELLSALAQRDLEAMGGEPVLAQLRVLERPRQANLLRYWLRGVHSAAASTAQLEELLDQVEACTTRGHDVQIKVADGFVRRAGEKLRYEG
jgi:tRNA(Ile)-lysidine synthase